MRSVSTARPRFSSNSCSEVMMPASSADDGGDDDDDNDALLGNDDPLARDRPREEDWRRVSECWVVA